MKLPEPEDAKAGWPWDFVPPPETNLPEHELPWIGIVTPSYNQGRFIETTLRSVILQNYPKLEFYVEDGGSTDDSKQIIEKYDDYLTGWVSEKDRGQSHAINKGMARFQKAEIVNWLNTDDYLMPGALWTLAEKVRANPDHGIYIGAARRDLRAEGIFTVNRKEKTDLEDILYWRDRFLTQPASWFRHTLFEEIGGIREDLHFAMDYDMWVRMFQKTTAFCFPEVLVTTVHHEDAKTVAARGKMYGEMAAVLFEHGYREGAINLVDSVYQEYVKASRIFRLIRSMPGGNWALNFYNRAKSRGLTGGEK